jgi:RNA polymerase sigma-70 factor (ECF subfamily)
VPVAPTAVWRMLHRGVADADAPALERQLRALYAVAREAWPGIELAPDVYLRHVAERSAAVPDAASAADLYLACACARGDEVAIEAFSTRYLRSLAPALRRFDPSNAFADEVSQAIREKLLVRRGDSLPRIAEFRGRGTLAAWVRIAATRTALRMRRRERPALDEVGDVAIAPDLPADVEYLRRRYRPEFEAALRAALAALSDRSRTLLRLHHVDGLSIDKIGAHYGVHRATAARWVAAARGELLEGTRRRASERLGVGRTELVSLMRVVASQLDVSLRQLAGDDGDLPR